MRIKDSRFIEYDSILLIALLFIRDREFDTSATVILLKVTTKVRTGHQARGITAVGGVAAYPPPTGDWLVAALPG